MSGGTRYQKLLKLLSTCFKIRQLDLAAEGRKPSEGSDELWGYRAARAPPLAIFETRSYSRQASQGNAR